MKSAAGTLPKIVTDALARWDVFQNASRTFGDEPPQPALVTLFRSNHGPLGKSYDLRNGKLHKTVNADLYDGEAYRIPVANLQDFMTLRSAVGPDMMFAYGIFEKDRVRIATEKALEQNPGMEAVARSQRFMHWHAGPGVWFSDGDLLPDQSITPEEFDELALGLVDWWGDSDRAYCWSSSSGIATLDGTLLEPHKNFRCYRIASDARAIPRLRMQVHDALWRGGHGRVVISDKGRALDKAILDPVVATPERPDFVKPSLGKGLKIVERAVFDGGRL